MNMVSRFLVANGLFFICSGCSVYIDDFAVVDTETAYDGESSETAINESDGNTGTDSGDSGDSGAKGDSEADTGPDSDGDSDRDTDSNSGIDTDACNVEIATPGGSTLLFCAVAASTTLLGCNDAVSRGACEDDELPLHSVSLRAFDMMKYEVTNAQFFEFTAATPSWAPSGSMALMSCNTPYLNTWYQEAPLDADLNKPVTVVCFDAAQAYCDWVGKDVSLPTEAQFEKAARGVYESETNGFIQYPFGDALTCVRANYQECYKRVLDIGTTVGPSPYGIFDMAGNVAEWTRDLYRHDYYCNPTEVSQFAYPNCNTAYTFSDPSGSASGTNYVVKGGSWSSPASSLRISARARQAPRDGNNLTGFRCVRNR